MKLLIQYIIHKFEKYLEGSSSCLIEILSQHSTGRIDENQEQCVSGEPFSRPRFESITSGKGVYIVTSMLAPSMKGRSNMWPVYSCRIEILLRFQQIFFFNLSQYCLLLGEFESCCLSS
jgi:hypothetical protein